MNWKNWVGLLASIVLIGSTFMDWTFYPDIQKYFTGFFTEKNYYGRPGILLCIIGGFGVLAYAFQKTWLSRVNLFMAGLGMAYAIKSYLLFTSSYDGYLPEKQAGIYLMVAAALINMLMALLKMSQRMSDPVKPA